jgi:hypothetical protein
VHRADGVPTRCALRGDGNGAQNGSARGSPRAVCIGDGRPDQHQWCVAQYDCRNASIFDRLRLLNEAALDVIEREISVIFGESRKDAGLQVKISRRLWMPAIPFDVDRFGRIRTCVRSTWLRPSCLLTTDVGGRQAGCRCRVGSIWAVAAGPLNGGRIDAPQAGQCGCCLCGVRLHPFASLGLGSMKKIRGETRVFDRSSNGGSWPRKVDNALSFNGS